MDSVLLFSKRDLSSGLEATFRNMIKLLQDRDPDALLTAPEADTVAELIDKGSVRCPVLRRDEWEMEEPAEATREQHNDFGRQVTRRVPKLTVIVPFDGEHEVFEVQARTHSFNPPRVASVSKSELRLTWEAPTVDAAMIRAHFEKEIDKIEEHLTWSRTQIEEHNQQVENEVPGLVARRRQELLNVRNIQAEIGIPIRRRGDASTYSVPVTRRILQVTKPARPKTGLFKPEPVLSEAQYEDALQVLSTARNGLERSPTTTAKLSEEEIRNLLLINLNQVFQGNAAGEVFNGDGKTDILVRIEDRNVFIGECKIWKGPKTIADALEQLFGYLVWRDTKAALLLFIRHADVTAVIDKAVAKIEEHPNFKRRGPHRTEDRHDFVMHAAGDPDREIHLALLPFALRTKTPPATTGA